MPSGIPRRAQPRAAGSSLSLEFPLAAISLHSPPSGTTLVCQLITCLKLACLWTPSSA